MDHLSLIRQLQDTLSTKHSAGLRYIIVDEVTYIQNWDMGVKFLADAGLLLAESAVTSHYSRWYPTYYIKAEGEVDVAYTKDNQFWPIEIKWTEQLRSKDLKQIQKYSNGIILTKHSSIDEQHQPRRYPLAWYLAKLGYQHYGQVAME